MKLLFLGVCAKYINPTNWLLPAALKLQNEVTCFGPGFVSPAILTKGIEEFWDQYGGFDLVLSTRLDWSMGEANVRFLQKYTVSHIDNDSLVSFAKDADQFLSRTDIKKIIFLTDLDVYAISEESIRRLTDSGAWFVAWAANHSSPVEDQLDMLMQEEFYARKAGKMRFGLWHDFVKKYNHRFINLGHFVAETEFNWSALAGRPYHISVPGQQYFRRRQVKDLLRRSGLSPSSAWYKFCYSFLDKTGARPYANYTLHYLYNLRFQQSILDARYAYTDGSGYERPLRKFFEIPALGTALLCTPFPGFGQLGFVDHKNAVVASPDDILDVISWLDKSPDVAQNIADAGRDLIWQRHSSHARSEQFNRSFEAIRAGRFLGTSWEHGEFIVLEKGTVS